MFAREWKLPRHTLTLGTRTLIMGVINLTPDSFSDGGKFLSTEAALNHAAEMIADGADILDVGGESTRPRAAAVSPEEELARVVPLIERLAESSSGVPISIDTTKANIARAALKAGAEIVNDISGIRFDPNIADEAARYQAGLILMHSRGTFETMHTLEPVANIMSDVAEDWRRGIAEAEGRGLARERIVLDPGIGFSKTLAQNIELLGRLDQLAEEFKDFPLLVGTSRKSFIGHLLEGAPVNKRIHGTMASVAVSILRGAQIIRVHDVRAARETARVIDAIRKASQSEPEV